MNKQTTIQSIEKKQLNELASFSAEQFTRVFGHMYEPEHLADHLNEKYSPAFFAEELKGDHQVLVATEEDKIVGYIKYGGIGLPIEYQPGDREIHRLYVHPSQQGRGIGRKFMDTVLDEISNDVDIYLGVWSENYSAQNFYKRFGFEQWGHYDYRVGPHVDHEFIFKRAKTI